ncbi:MAG: diguanylate cyclase [Rhodospirillales bacterium]|nr:diguanylate cyclase [Rhodospirillales bacterium]MCB9965871.1 diguanylate cyclase [Rhodospirillales bacterium]MCB9973368.1 diguanylate cyclase [Rhodospirillales bacterium]
MERLKQEGLAATPNNYEVWYVYFSHENQDVVRSIDVLLKSSEKLSEEDCHEIYNRFLSDNRTEERVRKAGDDLKNTINNVRNVVEGVKSSTHEYRNSLESISQKLSGTPSSDDLKAVVTQIQEDTRHVISKNQGLESVLEESAHEIEKLRKDLEKARKESLTDSLTGLSNRKAFDAEIQRVLAEAQADHVSFSVLMLDIDHFKSFNDNFGHQVGDQVLRLVAKCLTDGIKGKDIAARYGGEEFIIILPETELAAGVAVANNLRKVVANKDVINRNTGERLARITLSVGVAQHSGTETIDELIARADAALYTAKHNGRNQVAAAPTPVRKAG